MSSKSQINRSQIKWWVIMLPGEYAETSDLYGPFRSADLAEEAAQTWNNLHPTMSDDERAHVLCVQPATWLATAEVVTSKD